jgi:hypothetical protein
MTLPSKTSNASGPYTSKAKIESKRARQDFAPDGDLEKRFWKDAKWVSFDHDWTGKQHYARAQTRVASRWTPSQVYFAFWCRYTTLNIFKSADPKKDKWGLWTRDVVEVFLNPQPSHVRHYYEFEVSPNNLWIDLEIDLDKTPFNKPSWNSHFRHATRMEEKFWTCEMQIPIPILTRRGYNLRSGTDWRVNFFRADGRGGELQRRLLAWSPTLTQKPNFHVPTRFGLIRFIG